MNFSIFAFIKHLSFVICAILTRFLSAIIANQLIGISNNLREFAHPVRF